MAAATSRQARRPRAPSLLCPCSLSWPPSSSAASCRAAPTICVSERAWLLDHWNSYEAKYVLGEPPYPSRLARQLAFDHGSRVLHWKHASRPRPWTGIDAYSNLAGMSAFRLVPVVEGVSVVVLLGRRLGLGHRC